MDKTISSASADRTAGALGRALQTAPAHEAAMSRLVESLAAIPPGTRVRLAKPTSNLFRPRAGVTGPHLDTRGLTGVLAVDPKTRTAEVQGMCTYERLVAATLPHRLVPLVVPQLRTITLGGAVTGLGIESTSFRHGLPHESVLEADILTGSGEVVRATPTGEHAELFAAFPNSYGSLGYAIRLRIELTPVASRVLLRNIRFADLDELVAAVRSVMDNGSFDGEPVDAMDGVVFAPDEAYLILGRFTDEPSRVSDYTGRQIYYRSVRLRERDALTTADYLWRWDIDWFWCSRAFGAQHPLVRRIWPRRYRRSDVYHRLLGLEHRYGLAARLDRRRGRPPRERVVQDVEVPLERTAEFLRWFCANVALSPVWLCPVRLQGGPQGRAWPLYPLPPGHAYVNVGFWGTVPIAPGRQDGDVNRAVEHAVAEHEGHKSLYSDTYYSREEFEHLYGADAYHRVKDRYDPARRLTDLYAKVVERQ